MRNMPGLLMNCLLLPVLCMVKVTLVCWSFVVLLQHQATSHTGVIQRTHSWFKVSIISGRISSQPVVFLGSSVFRIGRTSVAVMIFSSPKCIFCVSHGDTMAGSRSLKYYLHLTRMTSALLSKTIYWSLKDRAAWAHLSRRPRLVREITFLAWGKPVYVRNPPRLPFVHFYSLGCGLSLFSVPWMRRRVGFFWSRALQATFFDLMATFILWFHQSVTFLPSFSTLSSFRSHIHPSSRWR